MEVFNLRRQPPTPRRHIDSNSDNLNFDSLSPPRHHVDNHLDDPSSFIFAPNYSSDSVSEPGSDPPDPFSLFGEEDPETLIDPFGPETETEAQLGLGLRLGQEFSPIDGLRVVGSDSESDTGSGLDLGLGVGMGEVDDNDWPVIWDCLRFDGPRGGNEEFEWEEVDERENLGSLIDRIEEISVSSGISSEEGEGDREGEGEERRNLEWEVLLAVNNFDRDIEFDGNDGDDGVEYLAVQDDYMYTVEYDTMFGQFVDSEGALKGSPPAAKSVVENLPSVVLRREDVKEINVVCAVCKDDVLVGDRVNKLPCSHYYHGDCIVPWLSIRNSCPVCRYELPTDDADYERRKNDRSNGDGLAGDLQFEYNFETLP